MSDDDLAMALPPPPPTNSARRSAAVDAALRRFDTGGSATDSKRVGRSWWDAWRERPEVAGFAAVALTAVLVAAPFAWRFSNDLPSPSASTGSVVAVSPSGVTAAAAPVPPSSLTQPEAPAAVVEADTAVKTSPFEQAADRSAARCGAGPCEPLTSPPNAPASSVAETMSAGTATSKKPVQPDVAYSAEERPQVEARYAPPVAMSAAPLAPPPPPERLAQGATAARIATADSDLDATSSIVVTAAKRARRAADRRGDWNACTVEDPDQRLASCRGLLNPGAVGINGRAAAQIADGLTLAWQGNLDAAIIKFDAAIEIAPRSPLAYLNRGLAYRRMGDAVRALDDLNKAVRYAPAAARGYYNRSLLFHERGDERRARRDAQQATDLDDRYRDLVK